MKRASALLIASLLAACGAQADPAGNEPSSMTGAAPLGSLAIARQQASEGIAVVLITDATGEDAQPVALEDPMEQFGSAIWSPDGMSLLITNTIRTDGDRLLPFRPAVVAPDGSSYQLLRPPGAPFNMFCDVWSLDGARVLCSFGNRAGGIFSIRVADGGDPVRLTRNPFQGAWTEDVPGSFSPDGSQLVFVRTRPASGGHDQPQGALFVKDIDGSSHRITPYGLPQWEEFGWAVQWSPDGDRILFASVEGAHGHRGHLYLINPDGSGLHRIRIDTAGRPYSAWSPGWAPDGSRIVFSMFLDGQQDMYTADPDGANIAQVTNTDAWENAADWTAP